MKCRILVALIFIFACSCIWIGYETVSFLFTPPEKAGRQIYFDVPQGATFAQIANSLADKGLITNARKFRWLARLAKQDHKLQAGRFALNSGWKPQKILDEIVNGKPVLYRITVPEGLTWWQTGRLLEDAGFVRFEDFKNVISDPAFLRHYGIPFASAEGFLMPDTYLLKKPDSSPSKPGGDKSQEEQQLRQHAWSVAGRMVDNFWRKAEPILSGKLANAQNLAEIRKNPDFKKIATLASIVEKETALDRERPRVAGVYANRIAKKMLLQADPTVIYGLGPDFSGPLLRSQLEDGTNPYNTYQKAGLTPGPICSYGTAALEAAVNPEKHDFLYFVARTDGGEHVFSKTLSEHNQAVNDYRRQKKSR